MTKSYFDNKRCLCIAGMADGQKILDVIRDIRPDLRDQLAVGSPGSFNVEDWPKYDITGTIENLGFDFIPLEETIGDTVDWILKNKDSFPKAPNSVPNSEI